MVLAKTLELQFVATSGETSISLDSPKEPLDPAAVKLAMQQIVASQVFTSTKGMLTGVKGARVIERNVSEYEL